MNNLNENENNQNLLLRLNIKQYLITGNEDYLEEIAITFLYGQTAISGSNSWFADAVYCLQTIEMFAPELHASYGVLINEQMNAHPEQKSKFLILLSEINPMYAKDQTEELNNLVWLDGSAATKANNILGEISESLMSLIANVANYLDGQAEKEKLA